MPNPEARRVLKAAVTEQMELVADLKNNGRDPESALAEAKRLSTRLEGVIDD